MSSNVVQLRPQLESAVVIQFPTQPRIAIRQAYQWWMDASVHFWAAFTVSVVSAAAIGFFACAMWFTPTAHFAKGAAHMIIVPTVAQVQP